MRENILSISLTVIVCIATILQGCSDSQLSSADNTEKPVNQTESISPSMSKGNFVNKDLAVWAAKRFANSYGFNYDNFIKGRKIQRKGLGM